MQSVRRGMLHKLISTGLGVLPACLFGLKGIVAEWHHMATNICDSIGSGNDLLPDGPKLLPESVLYPHHVLCHSPGKILTRSVYLIRNIRCFRAVIYSFLMPYNSLSFCCRHIRSRHWQRMKPMIPGVRKNTQTLSGLWIISAPTVWPNLGAVAWQRTIYWRCTLAIKWWHM